MTTARTSPSRWTEPDATAAARRRRLLFAGVLAGPLYVGVSLAQALTRDGFDLTRHPWSALANGDLRWIQMSNLAVTGLLVIAFAVGLSAALRPELSSTAAHRGLIVFGAGMIVAAAFPADPVLGFPVGTPENYRVVSGTGIGHLLAASTAFVGAVTACLALAGRFLRADDRRWGWASRGVAVVFLSSFVGLAATGSSAGVVAFTIGVVGLFSWIAALALRCWRTCSSRPADRSGR